MCHCRYDFVIVSYDMLKDVSEVLSALNFKVVILDESHCIKNPTVRAQGRNVAGQTEARADVLARSFSAAWRQL